MVLWAGRVSKGHARQRPSPNTKREVPGQTLKIVNRWDDSGTLRRWESTVANKALKMRVYRSRKLLRYWGL